MSTKPKYYITTAIAYASSKPHFGNTYEIIMTDAVARYKRQRGYDVYFLTGTDEHGQKIETLAQEAGISPKEYVDQVAEKIKNTWNLMDTTYDKFIRTTDDYHEQAVSHIFKKLYDQGDIYKGHYEGWYCTPCESFFTDTQLVNGKCPDCGRDVKKSQEEAYFFKMSNYADRLLTYMEEHPDFIQPEARRKEMINNFLKPGLQDLCVSRSSFRWGIPVSFDPDHVIYVWMDALTNYITALGYDPAHEKQPPLFEKYWPANVHMIGKDIVRFHSIYWPIFLMALDLPLPEKIFAHPWFKFGTDKMSKSRGNVVYADDLATHFSTDGVRYYALAEMPYLNDGSITYESVINRYNTDLANTWGNLVSRTVSMTRKYFDGVIPQPTESDPLDDDLRACALDTVRAFTENMDSFHIADAIETVVALLRRTNKYIDETTPWVLAKKEETRARLATVIYNLLEAIRFAAVMLEPIMPSTSQTIYQQIGTAVCDYDSLQTFGGIQPGELVGDASPLFARIDEKQFLETVLAESENSQSENASATVVKPEGIAQIGIEDFARVELRTAQVIACEKVPKAKKLLKLQLDLGYEQRQVVSGIAKFYDPDDMIGKKVVVVANLAPATLCGIESNGMILASGEEQIRVVFLSEDTPLGERIR